MLLSSPDPGRTFFKPQLVPFSYSSQGSLLGPGNWGRTQMTPVRSTQLGLDGLKEQQEEETDTVASWPL